MSGARAGRHAGSGLAAGRAAGRGRSCAAVTPPFPRLPPAVLPWACAIPGGALFALLHVPLAWMLGAMAATAALAWFRPVEVPAWPRQAALITLGLAFGQTFSGPVLGALAGALPAIIGAAVLSVGAGMLCVPAFMRLAGVDARTGFFSTIPGGVVVMAVLAQRNGAPVAPVTLAQTARVLVVVLVMPPLLTWLAPHGEAGAFLAPRLPLDWAGLAAMLLAGTAAALLLRRAGLANPWMMGPCALAIAAAGFDRLPSSVPPVLVDAAQVAMGVALGQRLSREFLLTSRRLLQAAVVSSLLLCALGAGFALALAWASGLPVSATLLGMAPGGMPEMGVTAKALGAAVPLVMGFHLCRTLFCSLLLGPVFALAERLRLFSPRRRG